MRSPANLDVAQAQYRQVNIRQKRAKATKDKAQDTLRGLLVNTTFVYMGVMGNITFVLKAKFRPTRPCLLRA